MNREIQVGCGMQLASSATSEDGANTSNIGGATTDRARHANEDVRRRQPKGAFDARAIRELSQAVPTDHRSLRRTIRRNDLRQIVPLADSTIYELERKGEFPQRFFLTPRCVVWDLAEVEAWLRGRRQPAAGTEVKKAPVPDYKLRKKEA
jgi:prophage regulatory protein